jgi:hypothetical protein
MFLGYNLSKKQSDIIKGEQKERIEADDRTFFEQNEIYFSRGFREELQD